MKTITVGALRQNPTEALAAIQEGESYEITRHRRVIARLVPPAEPAITLIPRTNRGGSSLSAQPPVRTMSETATVLAEMEDWR